jgi:ABC-2 type transport system permease protein
MAQSAHRQKEIEIQEDLRDSFVPHSPQTNGAPFGGRVLRVLAAEALKTRRTAVFWLALLTPLGLALALVWYLSRFTGAADFSFRALQALFETWTGLVLPLAAGLVCGLGSAQEEQAGNCIGLLGSPLPRRTLYAGKLLFLTLLSAASSALLTLVFLLGMQGLLGVRLPGGPFWLAAGLAEMGLLPLLALSLWISFAWGKGAAIAVGGAGTLVSALYGITSLGTGVWPFIPWAWSARLALAAAIFLPGFVVQSGQRLSEIFWNQTLPGLLPAAALFAALALAGAAWFRRWEGRPASE